MNLWLVVAAVLFVVTWILTFPIIYFSRSFDKLDKFIYTLLYRGYGEESFGKNAFLGISGYYGVEIIKYKEKGKMGLYLAIDSKDALIGKDEEFLKEVKRRDLKVHVREVKKERVYVVDMDRDIKAIKNIIKFVWKKILEKELIFYLSFKKNICLNPSKLIDFEDAKELEEKGIDIKIPITIGQWLIWKFKHPGEKV